VDEEQPEAAAAAEVEESPVVSQQQWEEVWEEEKGTFLRPYITSVRIATQETLADACVPSTTAHAQPHAHNRIRTRGVVLMALFADGATGPVEVVQGEDRLRPQVGHHQALRHPILLAACVIFNAPPPPPPPNRQLPCF